VGNEAKDDPSKDFWTVNGTVTWQEAKNTEIPSIRVSECPSKFLIIDVAIHAERTNRGVAKILARPGRKEANVSVRMA